MALSIPPHSADAPMVYVCGVDTAWKNDGRIPVTDNDHPLVRYFAGVTRYDLDADSVREFLDESNGPATYFYLRRLSRHELADIRNHERGGRPATAELLAFRWGLRKIENLDGCKFAGRELAPSNPISEEQVDQLESLVGPEIVLEIGKAVIRGTVPLSLAEKKRSDS